MADKVEYRTRKHSNNVTTVTAYENYSDANDHYESIKGTKSLIRTTETEKGEDSIYLKKSDDLGGQRVK